MKKISSITVIVLLVSIQSLFADFHQICLDGSYDEIIQALKSEPDINNLKPLTSSEGLTIDATPLMFAAFGNEDPRVIKLLLDAGADIEYNTNGITVLHLVAFTNNIPYIKILEIYGSNFLAKTDDGETPLQIAIFKDEQTTENIETIKTIKQIMLQKANTYFKENNYKQAAQYYSEIMKNLKIDGDSLYQYAVALDKLKKDKNNTQKIYTAAYYMLKQTNPDSANIEQAKSKAKIDEITSMWTSKIVTDFKTNAKKLILTTEATSAENNYDDSLYLVIEATKDNTQVYINWGNYIDSQNIKVDTAFNNKNIETAWKTMPIDNRAIFSENPEDLIKNLQASNTIIAKATPQNSNQIVASFNVSGLYYVLCEYNEYINKSLISFEIPQI